MKLCDKHLLASLEVPLGRVPVGALMAIGLMQLVNPWDYHYDCLELQCAVEDEGSCPLCYAEFCGLPLMSWAKHNYTKFHIEGNTVEYTFQD